MEFVEYADAEMMMIDLADQIASELRSAISSEGRASLAVPGGTTPGPIFDTLSAVELDWDKVHVLLSDERWVPETSERSNTGLVKRRLLTGHAAAAHYLPLYAEAEAPEARLAELEQSLAPHLPLSVVLLGMGADMHTASIFPGADRLDEALNGSAILVPMRAPGAPEPRITLSAKVLRDAMRCHIVIIGAEKRAALEKARELPPEQAPVAAILRDATVHWAES